MLMKKDTGGRATSGCVKSQVCTKNKLYKTFKSKKGTKFARIGVFAQSDVALPRHGEDLSAL